QQLPDGVHVRPRGKGKLPSFALPEGQVGASHLFSAKTRSCGRLNHRLANFGQVEPEILFAVAQQVFRGGRLQPFVEFIDVTPGKQPAEQGDQSSQRAKQRDERVENLA